MDIKKSKKNVKFTTIAWIMAIMLLVIIIPINILASVLDLNIDLTQNNMYSLTKTTTDYLSNLNEKVDFYFLMEMDEIRESDEAIALTSMLDEYSKFDCINFIDTDPDTNPDIKNELNPDGYYSFSKGDMVLKYKDNIKVIQGISMYSGEYDDDGNEIAEIFNGENYITGAIKTVVEGTMPSVYFLTGHGEKSLTKDYTQLSKILNGSNYQTKELNLVTEDAIPNDAAIVIVAAPKSDISDAEKSKIETFMDGGGNLSLLMSPNDDDIEYTNIEDLMHQYGLAMDYNIVSETDSSKHVSGDKNKLMVNLVDVSDTEDENIVDLTSETIAKESIIPYMTASRSFYQYQTENISDLTVCPLIETYDTALGTPYGGVEVDPDKTAGILYLGAYSQDRTRNDSKMVVMGNAEFIDDENVQDTYVIAPVTIYSMTIGWMYQSDINAGIPSKVNTNDYMNLMSEEDTTVMLVLLNAAPIIIAIAGIFIWLKRRNS